MDENNLMDTLDMSTQLRHAKKAIQELTEENKELKSKINLSLADVSESLCENYKGCPLTDKTQTACSKNNRLSCYENNSR